MENIERHFTTENAHFNNHTFGIYTDARKTGIFNDLEVPFRYFNDYAEVYHLNRTLPLQVTKQLLAEMEEEGLNKEQQIFIMQALRHWFNNAVFNDEKGKEYALTEAAKILALEMPTSENKSEESGFDFDQLKKELEAMPDVAQKIKYLLEQEALYKQQDGLVMSFGPSFGEKCRVEIKKLENILALEAKSNTPNVPRSNIFLTKKQGAKTNLLRVVDALWEMGYFTDEREQVITRGKVMAGFGQLLNEDLSTFESQLSQSYNNTKAETNLAVFDEMRVKIQKKCMPK